MWLKILFSSFILLTSCGYHLTDNSAISSYSTVSIPYVQGDQEGRLTSALIQSISANDHLRYVSSDGELILKVEIVKTKTDHTGYRYGRDEDGKLLDFIVPDEERQSILVKLELIESSSQKTIIGPDYLSQSVEYDFDSNINEDNLVTFSLGQLNFIESARLNSTPALYKSLSDKIAQYLKNFW